MREWLFAIVPVVFVLYILVYPADFSTTLWYAFSFGH